MIYRADTDAVIVAEVFAKKTQAAGLVSQLMGALHLKAAGETVGDVAADFAGDVVWPILVAEARLAVRALILLPARILGGRPAR